MEENELKTMCRLCLGNNGDLIYIFESKRLDGWTAADGILELLQIQVSEDDSYPQCVCDVCMEKMEDFKSFKDRCQSNRDLLDAGYGGISGVVSHEHEMEFVDEMKPLIAQWEAEKLAADQDDCPSGNILAEADGKLTMLRTRKESGNEQRTDACSSTNKGPDVPLILSTLTTTILKEQHGVGLEAISTICNPKGVDSGESECSKEEVSSSVQSDANERPESTSVLRVLRPRKRDTGNEANDTSKNSGSQRRLEMAKKIRGSLEHKWEGTYEKYGCNSCGICFAAKSNLRKHIESHLDGERRKSEGHLAEELVGKDTFGEASNSIGGKKRKGLKSVRGSNEWTCEVCKKKFKNRVSLASHCRNHMEKSFKCGVCNKGFRDKGHLIRHEMTHSGEKPFSCGDCGRRFALKSTLKIHSRTHTGEKPYECNKCKNSFRNPTALRQHQLIHSGEKPFSCGYCGRKFIQSGHLKVHLRIHTGEKPYECNECKKLFRRWNGLANHQLIHSGEKPYCCGDCGKRFTQKCNLKLHLRIHTGEKPYKCNECKKAFTVQSGLRQHQRIHSGEKPFSCEHCDRKFAQNIQLKLHLRVHTGEKPYKCKFCNKKFSRSDSLKLHEGIH